MRRLWLLLLLMLLPGLMLTAAAADLSGQTWRDLRSNAVLSPPSSQPQLMMLFAPDCRWCDKQMQHMQQLATQCSQWQFSLLGVNGSSKQLNRVLRQQQVALNAYLADAALLRQLGGVSATPVTLLLDREHKVLGQVQGYQSADRLQQLAAALTGSSCQQAG